MSDWERAARELDIEQAAVLLRDIDTLDTTVRAYEDSLEEIRIALGLSVEAEHEEVIYTILALRGS